MTRVTSPARAPSTIADLRERNTDHLGDWNGLALVFTPLLEATR
jgi:hypothetical protein